MKLMSRRDGKNGAKEITVGWLGSRSATAWYISRARAALCRGLIRAFVLLFSWFSSKIFNLTQSKEVS